MLYGINPFRSYDLFPFLGHVSVGGKRFLRAARRRMLFTSWKTWVVRCPVHQNSHYLVFHADWAHNLLASICQPARILQRKTCVSVIYCVPCYHHHTKKMLAIILPNWYLRLLWFTCCLTYLHYPFVVNFFL